MPTSGGPKASQRPSLEEFVLGLRGSRVEAVGRRAKYLLLTLDTRSVLVLHLGMSGGLRLQPKSQPAHPMVHHFFSLDDGRKFGTLWLVADPSEALPSLGPEPLGDAFTPEALARNLEGRNVPVKALLLEQSVVAEMGNLYADESLYLAGIHPLRPEPLPSTIGAGPKVGRSCRWAWKPWTIPRQSDAPCPRCGGPVSGICVRGRRAYFCPGCQP